MHDTEKTFLIVEIVVFVAFAFLLVFVGVPVLAPQYAAQPLWYKLLAVGIIIAVGTVLAVYNYFDEMRTKAQREDMVAAIPAPHRSLDAEDRLL